MYPTKIVIPNYNTTDFLKVCLRELDKHTPNIGEGVDVVLIDNGSEDGAKEYLSRCRENRAGYYVIYHPENIGVYKAWNKGMKYNNFGNIKEEFVVILGSDTEVQPGWIEALWDCFDKYPGAGIVSSMLIKSKGSNPTFVVFGGTRDDGEPHKVGFLNQHPDFLEARQYNWVTFSCVMLRQKMVDEIGLLDENYHIYCGDRDYCNRARGKGWGIWYWPESVCYHWEGRGVIALRKADIYMEDKIQEDMKKLRARWN